MIVTWAVAGLGMFCFLRALRLGSLPSLLGALSFAFAGAMSAQVAHFGLVAGMSWVPVQLLGVLRLTETRGTASRLRWIAVLAGTFGLTILAGEPRAIADAGVIVVIYAAWRVARLGRRCGPGGRLGRGAAGARRLPRRGSVAARPGRGRHLPARGELGGPVQLGLAPAPVAAADAGAGPAGRLRLARPAGLLRELQPDRSDGLRRDPPARGRGRPARPPPAAAAAPRVGSCGTSWRSSGCVLALGGNTPLGPLLVHLPLFGGQRLQSRNILVADLALAVLLAYWADHPLSERSRRFLRARGRRRIDLETILGVLPPLAMIAVVVLGLCWGAGLLRWLGVGPGAAASTASSSRGWSPTR